MEEGNGCSNFSIGLIPTADLRNWVEQLEEEIADPSTDKETQ
jgi:hypothetical protein